MPWGYFTQEMRKLGNPLLAESCFQRYQLSSTSRPPHMQESMPEKALLQSERKVPVVECHHHRCPRGERPPVALYLEPGVFSERCTEKLPLRVDCIHRLEKVRTANCFRPWPGDSLLDKREGGGSGTGRNRPVCRTGAPSQIPPSGSSGPHWW